MQCSICSFKATSQWKKWRTSFLERTVAICMILSLHSPLNSSTVIARAEDAHVILQGTAVFLEVYNLMISIKTEGDCLMVRLTFSTLFFLKTMKLRSQGPLAPVGGQVEDLRTRYSCETSNDWLRSRWSPFFFSGFLRNYINCVHNC